MGNDVPATIPIADPLISIHVPSWGTTLYALLDSAHGGHFNPRSLVGNDGWFSGADHSNGNFNPRSLVGNDVDDSLCTSVYKCISIHVPSWGTTVAALFYDIFKLNFNPRSLVGNDNPLMVYILSDRYFNPRSLVGNDNCTIACQLLTWDFNPRSLVGNDARSEPSSIDSLPFQSTFPRGERLSLPTANAEPISISIHVPSWGTTDSSFLGCVSLIISIHVPSWGTTTYSLAVCMTVSISIHVPSWGTTTASTG